MRTRIDEDRDLARENHLTAIESELKKYGCYKGLNGVELSVDDWFEILQDAASIEAAYEEAFKTIDELYKQAE